MVGALLDDVVTEVAAHNVDHAEVEPVDKGDVGVGGICLRESHE